MSTDVDNVRLENKLEWIYNISPKTDRETIVLQPGSYRLVYRGLNSRNVIYTKEKRENLGLVRLHLVLGKQKI